MEPLCSKERGSPLVQSEEREAQVRRLRGRAREVVGCDLQHLRSHVHRRSLALEAEVMQVVSVLVNVHDTVRGYRMRLEEAVVEYGLRLFAD